MKKLFCLFLCFIIIFTTACSRGENTDNATEPAGDYFDNAQPTDYINYDTTLNETDAATDIFTVESTQVGESTENTGEVVTHESTTKKTASSIAPSKKPSTTRKPDATAQVRPSEPSVSVTSAHCLHKNTTIKNKLSASPENDGYTGDTYCSDCGALLNKGETIEYVESETDVDFIKYPCPDGSFITVPVGTNIFDYTMEKAGKSASHDYYELENEVFRLFNEERVRLGISAVNNNEKAYYYVKKRAIEIQSVFSHTRPDGDNFSGVYEDEGIILCAMAENLVGHMTVQEGEDVAQRIFNAIMSSPSHKATALDSKYNEMSIAITYYDGQYYFCQHMYENVVH